jgi:metal-responsive CopG/Arc/MetJ family transcriptional regulator
MRDVNITVRINNDLLSKIDRIVSESHITRSEIIRRAIDEYIRSASL